jgi:TPR repeat protein
MPFRTPATFFTALFIATASLAQGTPLIDAAHRSYYLGQYGRALAVYLQRAGEGDAEAAERAGFMLLQGGALYGAEVPRNPDLAKKLLLQAARSGRAGASMILGLLDASD